jgi:hypothetical protein
MKRTAVQNLLNSTGTSQAAHDNRAAKALANNMSVAQVAASEIACNSVAVTKNAQCLAILQDRALALAAFDRISLILEIDKGRCYIPADQLVSAILA